MMVLFSTSQTHTLTLESSWPQPWLGTADNEKRTQRVN